MKNNYTQKGYTLLFAVLTAALVLGVAIFILNVSRKQYILSATARDSIYSLYAADSGIECAAGNLGVFASSSPGVIDCNSGAIKPSATPIFSGITYTDSSGGQHPNAQQTSFNLGFPYGCAVVGVVLYYEGSILYTVIDSRGYNICDALTFGPNTASPRIVERALRLTYQ